MGVVDWYLDGGQNLNFAIPVSEVRRLLRDRSRQAAVADFGPLTAGDDAVSVRESEGSSICGGNDPGQCLALAKAALREKDFESATRYAAEGCQLGLAEACTLGIAVHARDRQLSHEVLREVLPLTAQGCKLGDSHACRLVLYTRLQDPPTQIGGARMGAPIAAFQQACRASGAKPEKMSASWVCTPAPINPFDVRDPLLVASSCGANACDIALAYVGADIDAFQRISESLMNRYGIPRDDPGGDGCEGRRIWDWMTPDLKSIQYRILLRANCDGNQGVVVSFTNEVRMKQDLAKRGRAYNNY